MNATSVNLWFRLWIEHLTYKHSRCPFGSTVTSQGHTSVLFSLLSIIAQLNSLKSATNLSQNPSQLCSLAHRTVCHCKPICIALPECSRCDAFQIPCVTGALIRLGIVQFWFLWFILSSSIHEFCCPWLVYLCLKPLFLDVIPPPLYKRTVNVFVCLLSHFEFSFAKVT